MRALALLVAAPVLIVAASSCARGEAPPVARPGVAATQKRPATGPQTDLPRATVIVETPGGPLPFDVQVADDDAERQTGLMFTEKLREDEGMLFVFERERHNSFWMKNTLIPLDMLFIDDDLVVVGIVENAEPMTTVGRAVPGDSRYVLELAGGSARRLGLTAGQQVRFEGLTR